ncbi:uncharacterized protein IL334_001715 [Kwoniella shivajii]|uniref:Uncharacterized protein n=1 Tax=Kwoniella shivajii TaxID=564305 RepID=A0ABZ1CSR0_9TREE|nr:hypothetical protein IL334_001715 [Kwoniella shivajii]
MCMIHKSKPQSHNKNDDNTKTKARAKVEQKTRSYSLRPSSKSPTKIFLKFKLPSPPPLIPPSNLKIRFKVPPLAPRNSSFQPMSE